jgi:hypothetical protein
MFENHVDDAKSVKSMLESIAINNAHIRAVSVSVGADSVFIDNFLTNRDGYVNDECMSELERAQRSRLRITKEVLVSPISFGRERGEPIAEIHIKSEVGEDFSIYMHHHKGTVYFKVVSAADDFED